MSIFLGVVQGITEFLPISSSGHLSIIQNLFGIDYAEEEHLLFDVLLHLGTLFSVYAAYKKELKSMVKDCADVLTGKSASTDDSGRVKPTIRKAILIIAATLPLFIVLPFNDKIEQLYYNTPFISFALIITGLLLYVCGKFTEGRKNEKTATVGDAFVVGIAQAIATIPGLSRSGTTITVGISRGFKRSFAVQFSFFMSIPAVIGSVLLTLFKAIRAGIDWASVPAYIVGMIVAAIVGYYSIMLLRKLLKQNNFNSFAYYCWGAAIATLILSIVL
jgi:undecaprenyl-diphosphatase